MLRPLLCVGALAVTLIPYASAAPREDAEQQMKQLVQSFRLAEENYDVPALTRVISDRYVEVSPLGDVDAHDLFLSFYTADKKKAWPAVTVSEEQVRVFGDTAVDIQKFTYMMPGPDGGTLKREMRASFVAQRESGTWKLLSSHYTGIRPPAPAK